MPPCRAGGVGVDMVGAPWAAEVARGDEVVGVVDMAAKAAVDMAAKAAVDMAAVLQDLGEATVPDDRSLDTSKVCNL